MNILYIEDNMKDRILVERYIQTTPHQVLAMSNIDEFDPVTFPVDLILLDVYLGGKFTGLDYLEQLRSLGIQCPAIAITALTLPHQIEAYLDAGIDRIIEKPFEITEFADTIRNYAQQSDE